MKHLKNFKHNALKTTFIYVILLITIIMGIPSCSNNKKSDDTKDVTENNSADIEKKDEKFLVNAAEINLEEIKLGQLAQQNSTTPSVKEMGKMMETEHTKCLVGLKALAEKKSVIIPTSITEKGEDAYEKLLNITGEEFDKKYCDMMVEGHKDAISAFEKTTIDSNDPDIRTWASETLPSLRKHLDHALNCQKNCTKM